MNEELVYKAMTRPATIAGVPILPLIFTVVPLTLIFFATNRYLLIFIPVIIWVMKEVTKKDDNAFRLIMLKIRFFSNPLSRSFYGAKAYNASAYEKNKNLVNFGYPKLTPLNGLNQIPHIGGYLPYQTLVKDIVITKDFDFMATWQVAGVPFELENEIDIGVNKDNLNNFFQQFAEENVSFYFHNCRMNISERFDSKFDNEFLQSLNDKYYESFEGSSLKQNKLFITVIYSPIVRADKVTLKGAKLEDKIKQLNAVISSFRRICQSIDQRLGAFKPTRLTTYEKDGAKFSSQLEFYNFLISGKFHPVRVPKAPIYSYISGNLNEVIFSAHTIQLKHNTGESTFAKAIEIKDFPSVSSTGIIDKLMYEDVNYIITQSFVPINKKLAGAKIKLQEKRLITAEDDAISQIEDLALARDELSSGEIIFGDYHFSLLVLNDDKDKIAKDANLISTRLNEQGFICQEASIALPATYFAQFPANFGIRPRIHTISSANYASLIAFHNFPIGKRNENQWGEAITIFKTPNKQPFYMNFHQTDYDRSTFGDFLLGNTLVLGQSSGGKTVLMNFLLDQLHKFNNKSTFPSDIPDNRKKAFFVYLDKDKGAMGNIICAGGKYITINAGQSTGFNPFMCEATPENRRRLKVLMKMLATRTGKTLTTMEEENLFIAIDSVLDRIPDPKKRRYGMSLMLQSLTESSSDTNSVKSILKAWARGGEYDWVFDNEYDELNFNDDSTILYGIDGTDLLKDDEINSFVAYYMLWRILDLTDGRRFVLFVDEAWSWIKNETVAKEVYNKEKTIRKQNGLLVLGTQSVEDLAKSKYAAGIVEQSETVLLLSNPKASFDDYEKLSVTEEEFAFVKTTSPTLYRFIIKKGVGERAIASIDLSSVGKTYLKILSTGSAYVEKIEEINDDPNLDYKGRFEAIKAIYERS